MSYHKTDYTTAGQNPLSFTRYYNSRGAFVGTLGVNWRGSFDRYIQIYSTTSVGVQRADGQLFVFNLTGGVWVSDTDVDYKLTNSGTTWTLTDPDDTSETYTTTSSGYAAGDFAQLNTIQSRNGYTKTLTYNATGQLSSVVDSYSRTLTFTYNATGTLDTVTTPDSTTITYGYSSSSGPPSLTSVTFPTSPTTTLTYVYANSTLPHALTGVTDENGSTYLTWTYDAYGRALTSKVGTGANAKLTTVTYNDTTGARTVTNALGVTDTFTYSTLQNAQKLTGISRAATATTAAATRSFTFDANGYLASETDWNGNQTTYVNNSHGLPTTINEAVGSSVARTTTIAYDSTWIHLPHSITTPGLTTGFTYDSSGETLTKVLTDTTTQTVPYSTNGQTRTWTNTWSDYLLASVKTPNGNTTSFGYDSTGALTSVTDALSHITSITAHSGGGLPETIVDPNSVTTSLTYSPRQWLTSIAISGSGGTFTTTYTYDAAGNLTKKTLPDISYIQNTFDTAHRITKVTDALGSYVTYTLDALGDRTAYGVYPSTGGGAWRSHSDSFDALGRLLVDTGGRGQTITHAYDLDGNNTTAKDGFSHTTTNTFDALNRKATITDPNSGVTTLTYDAHNRLTNVKDANNHSTAYVFNGPGDAIQQTSPDSGTTVYHYDSDSNLTQKTDGAGVVMNAQYDALDRNTNHTYPADSTQDVWKTYDQTAGGYGSGIGRLTTVADAAGCCYSYTYDERGNITRGQRTMGSSYSDIYPTYDAAGRISGIGYPSGIFVGYQRDAAGYINEVFVDPAGSTTPQVVAWMGNAPFGPIDNITYGNNVTGPYQLDADYNISNITQTATSGTLQNVTYTLDNNNNVTGISDAVTASDSETLGYDIINRLTSAASGTGGYGSYGWTYDKVGNRLTQTVGTTTTNYSYTSGTNRLSAIGSTSVATNANGNITSIPPANSGSAATFAYNVANRLSSVTGSPTGASFVYDFQGQRFTKTASGSHPTYYTYGLDGTTIEENNNGTVTDYIYVNGRPIGIFVPVSGGTSGTMYYVHGDHLGTPQFATNNSQSVVWSTTYQPFGTTNLITGTLLTQNTRLPGQRFDVETGFHYNGRRDYMPNLGRYLQADPIGLAGGMNPYAYANGNPHTYIDINGRSPSPAEVSLLLIEYYALQTWYKMTYPQPPSPQPQMSIPPSNWNFPGADNLPSSSYSNLGTSWGQCTVNNSYGYGSDNGGQTLGNGSGGSGSPENEPMDLPDFADHTEPYELPSPSNTRPFPQTRILPTAGVSR